MIEILITGDFCPINKIESLSLEGNHDAIFNDFLKITQRVDLAITNLECPLTDTNTEVNKIGPCLKAAVKTVETLKYGNFGLVTLANNHIMDQGIEGLNSTLNCLNQHNIDYVGVGKNLQSARRPFIKTLKNKKIAFFNFAENEFSNSYDNGPGANPLSLVSNFNSIQSYRNQVDKIIVIVHGGNEMHNLPSPRFKETLRFFVDAGSDAVVAHHSHCCSGYEFYKEVPIFYGLGNFLFDYKNRDNHLWTLGMGIILKLNDNKITFELIPFFQNKENQDGIKLLEPSERVTFDCKMNELNAVIADDILLNNEFQKFILAKKKQYSHFLEPYSNRILHALFSRKLMPSFYSKRKKLLLLNLIRCESHRDIILNLLSK